MKILKFKGKMSIKNKILIALAVLLIIAIATVLIIYITNEELRNWIDTYVLRKEITEDDIATIELSVDKTQYIYAYGRCKFRNINHTNTGLYTK